MLQRIQTLYLLAAVALCVGCLCTPIAHFVASECGERLDMYNLWLTSAQGGHLFSYCPVLMGLLVITSAILFLDICLYTHRALQMRLASLSMILLVSWYIAYGCIICLIQSDVQVAWRPHWTAALPAVALILTYLAFRGILRDEMLVRSLDRLR